MGIALCCFNAMYISYTLKAAIFNTFTRYAHTFVLLVFRKRVKSEHEDELLIVALDMHFVSGVCNTCIDV